MPDSKEQFANGGGREAAHLAPVLELRLLGGGLLFRDLPEFRRALRHRYVLANFAGLTVPAIVLLYALDSTRMPIDLQVPAVVVGLVAAQTLILVYLSAAVWLTRLFYKDLRVIRIWITPGLLLGAAGMLGTVHVMHQALDVAQDWTEVRSRLVPFLCVLYLELAANFVFRGPMPRALANLRGGENPFAYLDNGLTRDGDAAAASDEAVTEREKPAKDGESLLRIGINPADILRLEASGNYVTVVTGFGRQLVPGPFSAVVAQMPKSMGRQVQRSHWVALAGVEGVKRQGRELVLQMACGALVPVSAALKSEVQAWLASQGKAGRPALADASARRTGGRVS
jgi:DNA-binding LytR/AlgR family response regulator